MQEFIQLPLLFIWQQQLRSVMQQALAHELSSLPQALQDESAQLSLPRMASKPSTSNAARDTQAADSAQEALPKEARHPSRVNTSLPSDLPVEPLRDTQTDTEPAAATQLSQAAQQHPAELTSELLLPGLKVSQQLAQQSITHPGSHASQSSQSNRSPPALRSRQTPQLRHASHGRLPQQATRRGLPNQAPPAQPTFLRVCFAELLRLTHPARSQYQPLLCGWFTQGDLLLSPVSRSREELLCPRHESLVLAPSAHTPRLHLSV